MSGTNHQAGTVEIPFRATGTDEVVRAIGEIEQAATRAADSLRGIEVASPRVSILKEPLTYEARLAKDRTGPLGYRAVTIQGGQSYFKDLVLYQLRTGDWQAAEQRLQRHAMEMKAVGEARSRIFHPDVEYDFEQRAVNWANGTGGYFAPPLWLVEWFATVPTPERVLSALAPQFELPQGAQSVNLPRLTAGADVGETQVDGSATDVDLVDAAPQSAVATIAGNADVPMQMLEQSPVGAHLDWVVFTNMEARYGYRLEQQMLVGTGVATPQGSGNNQLLGILNNPAIPAANVITYNDATPSVNNMIRTASTTQGGPLPAAIAAIGNNRQIKPEIWMMTTSRAAWVTSGEVNFPLALGNQVGPGAFDLLAYPVEQNDAIPTNLGATGNQDTIICCRPSDWILLESERRTSVYTDNLSGTLMARLQLRRYAAALLRQPSAAAYLSGTGMIVQPGF